MIGADIISVQLVGMCELGACRCERCARKKYLGFKTIQKCLAVGEDMRNLEKEAAESFFLCKACGVRS